MLNINPIPTLTDSHFTSQGHFKTEELSPSGESSIFRRSVILSLLTLTVMMTACNDKIDNDQDNKTTVIKSLLPDSGQTTSYTLTEGEDADFSINPPSYSDNGNGTITDNITGLMWQKTDAGEMTFENASSYCSTLNLGGFDDWRLPTCIELFGINNYDKVNPAMDIVFFTKTAAEYWWTGEFRADNTSSIWVVNAGGGIGAHPKTETVSAGGTRRFHVRAVRNIKSPGVPDDRFFDNGDGTVRDSLTGLEWQQIQSSTLMTWEEALVYASGLMLAGNSDWRLPNIKELQSLNEEMLSKPSFNKVYFLNVISGNYWSSTTLVNSTTKAWDINVDYGIVSYNEKTLKENVLCVRGGEKGR